MVILRVATVNTRVEGLTDRVLIDKLSDSLSYMTPNYKYNVNYKYGGWDGRSRLLAKNLTFPSGLVDRVHAFFIDHRIECEIQNEIEYPVSTDKPVWHGPDLYPYQVDAISRALEAKRGMIKSCTGSGKTLMIAKIVAEYNLPTMIYVVSLDLLGQMRETLESVLHTEIGVIGDGKCIIRPITVCSVWTAGSACGEKEITETLEEDVKRDTSTVGETDKKDIFEAVRSAKVVILDEAHFAAANSIRMILKNSTSASYKFGCTATPWRSSGDDLLLEAAFGSKICDITASKLINEGYLVKPKIVFRDIPASHAKTNSWEVIKASYITNNKARNKILVDNTVKLLEMGRKPLVLFREIKHGNNIVEILPSDIRLRFVTGSLKTSERDQIRQDFKAGLIDLICASTVYDQGIDIKELDALILCGGGKSTAKALQRIGRVLRGNPGTSKKDAFIVDTFDQAKFVKPHSLIRYDAYATEEAFAIKISDTMKRSLAAR